LERARRKGRESLPKARVLGVKTVKIMSKHTEDKVDKKELEKRCQQLQEEREEMWERLGMNWRKGTCLPNPKDIWDKTSFKL
jgi:hypothetical protein